MHTKVQLEGGTTMRRQIRRGSLRWRRWEIRMAAGSLLCQRTYWPTPEGLASNAEQCFTKFFSGGARAHSLQLTVLGRDRWL